MAAQQPAADPAPPAEAPISPAAFHFVFLGTASMAPSTTRNVSGNALRIGGEWWIVDAGEGTQHQINKSSVASGHIMRVFVTHLHGDHCFGVPGLLCKMNVSDEAREADRVVQLVGPKGLRQMLRAALLSTSTFTTYRWRVDELHQLGPDPAGPVHFSEVFQLPPHPSEVEGLDVLPEADGSWVVPAPPVATAASDEWRVRAAPLRHTIFSVGFIFREAPHRGTVDANQAKALLLTAENKTWQREHRGVKNPMQLLGRLQKGQPVDILRDGVVTQLQPGDVLSPPKPGRVVAVIGDSSDSSAAAPWVVGADLLVHEATNAALTDAKGVPEDEAAVTARTIGHGHSTPPMAGAFARACAVRTLALTHFSSRYKGDDSPASTAVMNQIVRQAAAAFRPEDAVAAATDAPFDAGGAVFAAHDLLEIEVPVKRPRLEGLPTPAEAREAATAALLPFDELAAVRADVAAAAARAHLVS